MDYCLSCGEYFEDGFEHEGICSMCQYRPQDKLAMDQKQMRIDSEESHVKEDITSDSLSEDIYKKIEQLEQYKRYTNPFDFSDSEYKNKIKDLDTKILELKKNDDELPVLPFQQQEYSFMSHSIVGKSYTVTNYEDYYECDCPGFRFKKKCRHVLKVLKMQKND